MPLTAPPRWALEPQRNTFSNSVSTPQVPTCSFARERKGRRVLKNVAVIHAERFLNIDRALAFDAQTAIPRHGEAILQRLVQPLIHALEESFLGPLSHRLVVADKQIPGVSRPKSVIV